MAQQSLDSESVNLNLKGITIALVSDYPVGRTSCSSTNSIGDPRSPPQIQGKKLAVLGEQKVGKTCLIDFLTTGSLPRKYEPDSFAREVQGRRFKLRDLKLNIPSLKHLPGSADDYAQWEEVTNEADIVLYLFRV